MLNHVGLYSGKIEERERRLRQEKLERLRPIANLRLDRNNAHKFKEIVNLGFDDSTDYKQSELDTRADAREFVTMLVDELIKQEGEMLEVFGAVDRNQGRNDFISWQSSFPIGISIPTSLQNDGEKAVAAIGVAATVASLTLVPGPTMPIAATLAGMTLMSAFIAAAFSSKERNNVIFVANTTNKDLRYSGRAGRLRLLHHPADHRIPAATASHVYVGVFVISDEGAGDPVGLKFSEGDEDLFSLGFLMDYRDDMAIKGKNKLALGWEKTGSANWKAMESELENTSHFWSSDWKGGVHVGMRMVSVEKDANGDYHEPGDTWFPKCLISVNPTNQPDTRSNVAYSMTIQTSNVWGAGTDSNIQVELVGSLGRTGWIKLNQRISGNAFEQGSRHVIQLGSHADVGDLQTVFIHHDGKHSGSAWNMDWFQITDPRGKFWPINNKGGSSKDIDGETLTFTV